MQLSDPLHDEYASAAAAAAQATPLYLSEMAPFKLRGALNIMFQVGGHFIFGWVDEVL